MTANLFFFNPKVILVAFVLFILGWFAVGVVAPSIHGQNKHSEYTEVDQIFTTGECSPGYRAEYYSQKLNTWMHICQVGNLIPVRFSGKGTWGEKVITQYFAKFGQPLKDAIEYINRKIITDGYVLKSGTPPAGINAVIH
jgi:hypothetical protein